jgi:hypothetical protein
MLLQSRMLKPKQMLRHSRMLWCCMTRRPSLMLLPSLILRSLWTLALNRMRPSSQMQNYAVNQETEKHKFVASMDVASKRDAAAKRAGLSGVHVSTLTCAKTGSLSQHPAV